MVPNPLVATTAVKGRNGKAKATPVASPVAKDVLPKTEKEEDVPFTVSEDGTILSNISDTDETTVTLKPPPGTYATMRLDLLPSVAHQGSLLRNGAKASAIFAVTVESQKAGTKEAKPITIHSASANRSSPGYTNGAEDIGVQDEWRTSATEWNLLHSACYLFARPLQMGQAIRSLFT